MNDAATATEPTNPTSGRGPIARLAAVSVQTNALVLICMGLMLLIAFLLVISINAANRREPMPVAFVKLHPNGSYHVSYYDADMPFSIFESTINAMLRKAVESRFREDPDTIVADYNIAALFLGSRQLGIFLNEFNATEKIQAVRDCASCPVIVPRIQALQHLENLSPDLEAISQGRITRSTMYLTLEHRSRTDGALIRSENKILPIEWRLDPQKLSAIAAGELSLAVLNTNPIGLTILSWTLTDDLASGD